jgi:hypothetical protein
LPSVKMRPWCVSPWQNDCTQTQTHTHTRTHARTHACTRTHLGGAVAPRGAVAVARVDLVDDAHGLGRDKAQRGLPWRLAEEKLVLKCEKELRHVSTGGRGPVWQRKWSFSRPHTQTHPNTHTHTHTHMHTHAHARTHAPGSCASRGHCRQRRPCP